MPGLRGWINLHFLCPGARDITTRTQKWSCTKSTSWYFIPFVECIKWHMGIVNSRDQLNQPFGLDSWILSLRSWKEVVKAFLAVYFQAWTCSICGHEIKLLWCRWFGAWKRLAVIQINWIISHNEVSMPEVLWKLKCFTHKDFYVKHLQTQSPSLNHPRSPWTLSAGDNYVYVFACIYLLFSLLLYFSFTDYSVIKSSLRFQ